MDKNKYFQIGTRCKMGSPEVTGGSGGHSLPHQQRWHSIIFRWRCTWFFKLIPQNFQDTSGRSSYDFWKYLERFCTSKTPTINQWKPLTNKILSYPIYMINRNKNFRSMLLRRTRLSKSLSIDNTGLNWWYIWKRIQLQVGVWIFFVDSSQTPQRQSSTTSSTAMRLQQFSSKTAKVPKAVFYSGLHYICLVKSVNFCVPSPQILFCVILVIKTHALSSTFLRMGSKVG